MMPVLCASHRTPVVAATRTGHEKLQENGKLDAKQVRRLSAGFYDVKNFLDKSNKLLQLASICRKLKKSTVETSFAEGSPSTFSSFQEGYF